MGSRNKKKRKKRTTKSRVISWLLTFIFLFLFYIIFCGFIGNKRFYANTSINGIDVSKMTAEEAAEEVRNQFEADYNDAAITVLLKDEKYKIEIADALNLDVRDAVNSALSDSHGFMSRGYMYIKSMFTSLEYSATPSISDRKAIAQAIQNSGLNELANSGEKIYKIENDSIKVTKGRGGYEVDSDNLMKQIEAFILSGDLSETLDCPIKYSEVNLEHIYNDIYVSPQNPTLNPDDGYSLIEAVRGVSFDMELAENMLKEAEDGEELSIPLVYTEPNISTEEFKAVLFRDALGSFATSVGGSDYRKTNVRLAAEHCNDTILLPGETFSFNNVVGQRTTENGFKPAPSYVNGESVDEVGGGICQVSSTLYNACLYANLQIDERHCHPHESGYVEAGFDATVSWGGPDYMFSNNTNYPIKVSAVYDGSYVYCAIYGTKEKSFYVELTSETISVEEYETEYEDDDTMEEGEEEVSVRGINGFTVQTYRKVYDGDGNLIYNEPESMSTYSKQDEIIKVGTKKDSEEDTTEEDITEDKKTKKKKKTENSTEENNDADTVNE